MRFAASTTLACLALGTVCARPAVAGWLPAVPGAAGARGVSDEPAPPSAGGETRVDAAGLLAAADEAVDAASDAPTPAEAAVELRVARRIYERLIREYPTAPQVDQARRALKLLAVGDRMATRDPTAVSGGSQTGPTTPRPLLSNSSSRGREARPGDDGPDDPAADQTQDVVIRREPYSRRTAERLRLTSWEKLDFGVTAFLYGASMGASFALNTDADAVTVPIAFGAVVYTLGAVVYLQAAHPDRGDLPLALAITSYVPTTVLLVSNLAFDSPDDKKVGLAVAVAGVFSVPIALAATQKLDLDPGDMQLVRDAGFWGLGLATTLTLGFGGKTTDFGGGFTTYDAPPVRNIAGFGLLGLYGGLGLGILAAANSEVSLERVRVTTWGGYGGALVGALMGLGIGHSDDTVYRGLAFGALAGLVIAFATTGGLDGIPEDDASSPRASRSRWTPTMVPVAGVNGQAHPGLGLSYALR